MARQTEDPWAWADEYMKHAGGVPALPNQLPQVHDVPVPANISGPRLGPVTAALEARAINKGFDAGEKALFKDAPTKQLDYSMPTSNTTQGIKGTPDQLPKSPLSQPEPTVGAPAETVEVGSKSASAAPLSTASDTGTTAATAAAVPEGVEVAGLTAEEIAALLAAQEAVAAGAAGNTGAAAYASWLAAA